jgi:hypothetical protein
VKYGSSDSDSFSFDPNMGIPTDHTINVGIKDQSTASGSQPCEYYGRL